MVHRTFAFIGKVTLNTVNKIEVKVNCLQCFDSPVAFDRTHLITSERRDIITQWGGVPVHRQISGFFSMKSIISVADWTCQKPLQRL